MDDHKKDPRGLVAHDMKKLHSIFKRPNYTPKRSYEEIMFIEGQQSVIEYIEREMINGRNRNVI